MFGLGTVQMARRGAGEIKKFSFEKKPPQYDMQCAVSQLRESTMMTLSGSECHERLQLMGMYPPGTFKGQTVYPSRFSLV